MLERQDQAGCGAKNYALLLIIAGQLGSAQSIHPRFPKKRKPVNQTEYPLNLGRHVMMASVIVSSALMGCASPKSYLGASFPKVTFEDVKKRDAPLHLRLVVEFQRNGQHFSKGDIPLRDYATRIFKESGVISPVDMLSPGDDKEEGTVKVVLNNIADSGTVATETARSGFPLWMVGKTITDAYEMSMIITTKGKTISRTGIKHAFHTAIGNIDIPDHLQPFPSDQAFGRMLRQMILKALIDMQKSGELGWRVGQPSFLFGEADQVISQI